MPVVSVESYHASARAGKVPGFWLEGREIGRPTHDRGPTLVWIQLEDPDDKLNMPDQVSLNGMVRDTRGNKKTNDDTGSSRRKI